MSDSATPWAVARQVPLSMGFSRQEYWSGLPFPSAVIKYEVNESEWSEVALSCLTLCDPMDCSLPASSVHLLSMDFSKQEYWSGLPFPSPEILHIEAIKLMAAMIIIIFIIIIANTQSQFIIPHFSFLFFYVLFFFHLFLFIMMI